MQRSREQPITEVMNSARRKASPDPVERTYLPSGTFSGPPRTNGLWCEGMGVGGRP